VHILATLFGNTILKINFSKNGICNFSQQEVKFIMT